MFYLGVILSNDANGRANSEDPDQTAPLGAVWSGSALFTKTHLSENFGSVRYIITKDLLKKYVSSIPIEKLNAHLWKELLLAGHLTKQIRLLLDDDWRIIWISSHVVNVGTTYNEYPQVLFLCRKEQNKLPNFLSNWRLWIMQIAVNLVIKVAV